MPDAAALPTVDEAVALGLTRDEYALVVEKLGRAPNQVELAMFSLLWSEHCAYKHSKKLLRTLPTEGEHVLVGPGENAGVVDVGRRPGVRVQGRVAQPPQRRRAVPGRGDRASAGSCATSSRSAPGPSRCSTRCASVTRRRASARATCSTARSRGIGHYGNSIGVPTIGGEVYFEGPYEQNCLVNAMALGLADREKLVLSAAAGVGNLIVLYGASTGRDGIGGASVLASAELGEADEDKRPTVQVGDPFEESKLVECSLQLLEQGLIVALQDLGAAGITSSASEMASKGGVGIDLHVDRVPLREADMEPFEIMVSESQERMLCVVEPARVDEVIALTDKWEVHGTVVGEVTDTGHMRIYDGGDARRATCPVAALVDDCPIYDLRPGAARRAALPGAARDARARRLDARRAARAAREPEHRLAPAALRAVRRDRPVAHRPPARRSATPRCSRCPAAPRSPRVIDGNGRRVAADPYWGTVAVVLECASNLACAGAEALGTTNNLNFGNPEKPHIAWQLDRGGARASATPAARSRRRSSAATSRSTTRARPARSTRRPVIGMVGRMPDVERAGRLGLRAGGRRGRDRRALPRRRWRRASWPSCAARSCPTALPAVRRRQGDRAPQDAIREAVREGAAVAARTTSPRAASSSRVAECCLAGGIGATLDLGAVRRTRGRTSSARARAASSSRAPDRDRPARRARAARRLRRRRRRHAARRDRRRGARRPARRAARGARRPAPVLRLGRATARRARCYARRVPVSPLRGTRR